MICFVLIFEKVSAQNSLGIFKKVKKKRFAFGREGLIGIMCDICRLNWFISEYLKSLVVETSYRLHWLGFTVEPAHATEGLVPNSLQSSGTTVGCILLSTGVHWHGLRLYQCLLIIRMLYDAPPRLDYTHMLSQGISAFHTNNWLHGAVLQQPALSQLVDKYCGIQNFIHSLKDSTSVLCPHPY